MNVQPIFALNEAEQALAEAYRGAVAGLPGAGEARVRALRDQAIARFEAAGLPHRRMEAWKYTDLRRHLRELPEPAVVAGAPADIAGLPLRRAFEALEPYWLVFVDGRHVPALSGGAALPEGVEVRALAEGPLPDWAVEALDAGHDGGGTVFDLNTALMEDGALVRVAAGVTGAPPIAVLHLGRGDGTRHLRHVVVVEDGAALAMIEAYGALEAADEVTTAAAVWRIGDNATVDHVKVQQASPAATHLAPHVVEIGAAARVNSFTLTLGAGLAREERHVRAAGEASDIAIGGTYFLDGHQHGDTTLVVTHVAPGCTSRERFKGLVDGAARGVFQGRVVVERAAQKTDAKQSVDALLLSDEAEHDAKPELEIYADDVACGHGATTGELDDDALFYLRARGLDRVEAERLLIAAFIRDGLEGVAHEGLRAGLDELAAARLEARAGGAGDA